MTSTALAQPHPIPVSTLTEWIPHRAPMIWIDEVAWHNAQGGECLIHVKEGALYLSSNGLRPSSIVEFIAQSFGYIGVCQALEQGAGIAQKKSKAFLVAMTHVEFGDCTLARPGTTLRVRVSNAKQVGPITLFDGQVFGPGDSLLGKASLKVYAE